MNISLIPLHKNVEHLQHEEQLLVKIVAPNKFPEVDIIPSKYVCFVIDTSCSMEKDFDIVIESVISGISRLRNEDYVTIILYNCTVKVLCEWNKCSDVFKDTLKDKMKMLKCIGSTNISCALLQSIEQSMKVPEKEVTTLFLTDGKANEGVTDINNLGVLLKKLIPKNNVIHTLGFNVEHNPIFLKKISEVCNNGTYSFVKNEDELRCAFLEIIGKTMDVAYQNVKLTLEGDEINFYDLKSESDFSTLPLSDLHIGESKKELISMKFTKEKLNYCIRAKIESFNVIELKKEVHFAEITLERGDNNILNEEVKSILNNFSRSKEVKKASNENKYTLAKRILLETSSKLKSMPSIKAGLDKLVMQCKDNTILNESSHNLTSYQQELEVEKDSIFIRSPSAALGISPIKRPNKKVVENFFPITDQNSILLNSKAIQNPVEFDSNSPQIPELVVDSTIESVAEEQSHT